MGFKYDPSTAGSSVRFDPPHPGDRVRSTISRCIALITWSIHSPSLFISVRSSGDSIVHILKNLQRTLIRRYTHIVCEKLERS